MILTKIVSVKMNGKHITRYRELGYTCSIGDIVDINIVDLPMGSNSIVDVICDVCGNKKSISYRVYNKSYNKDNYYACSVKCGVEKYKKVIIEKYGVDNYAKTTECKNKIKETCLNKYGHIAPAGNKEVMDKMIKTRIHRGIQNNHIENDIYKLYRKLVRKITDTNKKILLENWNGYDYYDNEYIKDNFNINSNSRLYPTVDHKISIYYGYNNGIPAEEIGKIDNLCITKRGINSSKNIKNDEIFRKL